MDSMSLTYLEGLLYLLTSCFAVKVDIEDHGV